MWLPRPGPDDCGILRRSPGWCEREQGVASSFKTQRRGRTRLHPLSSLPAGQRGWDVSMGSARRHGPSPFLRRGRSSALGAGVSPSSFSYAEWLRARFVSLRTGGLLAVRTHGHSVERMRMPSGCRDAVALQACFLRKRVAAVAESVAAVLQQSSRMCCSTLFRRY